MRTPDVTAFDLPLEELRAYRPERSEPPDFDAFWADTITAARGAGATIAPRFDRIDGPLRTVIEYIGYGGGRSLPFQWLRWAAAGYAHLVMDTRGQGSAWSPGDTPDLEADAAATGGHFPGFVTRGVERPETWYYRRLVTDAVRAVDDADFHQIVDRTRDLVASQDQGSGIGL